MNRESLPDVTQRSSGRLLKFIIILINLTEERKTFGVSNLKFGFVDQISYKEKLKKKLKKRVNMMLNF